MIWVKIDSGDTPKDNLSTSDVMHVKANIKKSTEEIACLLKTIIVSGKGLLGFLVHCLNSFLRFDWVNYYMGKWNFIKNIKEYNEAKKNLCVVKMWSKIPLKEVKKKYYNQHKGKSFIQKFAEFPAQDFIVNIENEGYWLSGIIDSNFEKEYGEIRKVLFNGKETKLKWSYIGGKLESIIKSPKSRKEIEKQLNIPS